MRVLWFLTAALCVFPPSSLGCGENLMTSSMKNIILKEHNDRREEINRKILKRTSIQYKICRRNKSTSSRCPSPPFYDPLRRDKVEKEVPYNPDYVPPLLWDSSIARKAQSWAENLACREARCGGGGPIALVHDYESGYGENLACKGGRRYQNEQNEAEIERFVIDMIDGWWGEFRYAGDEIGEAMRSMPGGKLGYDMGHFAQMAWAETLKVGCGVQRRDSKIILVCNYSPQGNYQGRPVVPEYKGYEPTRVEWQVSEGHVAASRG